MKILSSCTTLHLLTFLAGCSSEEKQTGDPSEGGGTHENVRREVLLTLKNELALNDGSTKASSTEASSTTAATTSAAGEITADAVTKADAPIATADENKISSLDVYVFGAETEEGDYTFQERFAYRATDAAEPMPTGATQPKLNAVGADAKETTGLLKLKKGLFVKLYCIANNSILYDAAGNEVTDASFVPLTFTESGNGVQTAGKPKESDFTAYHTPLLSAAEATDILTTPLAMSGAYITPLDLTDFESSARMQVSFKLTRLAARFDIVNTAGTSKFTIESVSMGNGRRGATYFPIKVYGATTALDGELITYPERLFDGDNANLGIQTGAFYSYPSPKDDLKLVLPAAGYRGTGGSELQGTWGYYWLASASGTVATNAYFSSGTAYSGTNYRVNAFSVRCVQE